MPDYRTPLPAILAGSLESAINRVLAMDANSPRRLQQLQGKRMRLVLEGLGITLDFCFAGHRLAVSLDTEGEADTVVSGSPAALFAMALPDGEGRWGTPGSRVKISGDATLARDLERVFSSLDLDWEDQLATHFGDVLGHQLAAGARGAVGQIRETLSTVEGMTSEFLHRPASPLAQAEDVRAFAREVDVLRDATERLEARLRLLREQGNGAADGGSTADEPT